MIDHDQLAAAITKKLLGADPCLMRQLFEEFCRLRGFSVAETPIARLVDEATGYEAHVLREFAGFLVEFVVLRGPIGEVPE